MGNNNVEQLAKIMEMIGQPQKKLYEEIKVAQPLTTRPIRSNSLICELTKEYPEVDFMLVDLIEQTFKYSPSERITASEALLHPYFSTV